MTDIVSRKRRSEMMSGIRSRDTKPEIAIRQWLHHHGYRFRLHRKDLPGRPDIVLPGRRLAIFVHGCFWHRHEGCKLAYTPKSNLPFWEKKFAENRGRDQRKHEALTRAGWRIAVIWECEVRNSTFPERLAALLDDASVIT